MDFDACLRELVGDAVAAAVPTVAAGLADLARERAPVDSGDTRKSIDWEPLDRASFRVTVGTVQGAIQDAGSGPHPIVATRSHGILANPATGFIVGGSGRNPARVIHPGSTKHVGWFSAAPWDEWAVDLLREAL